MKWLLAFLASLLFVVPVLAEDYQIGRGDSLEIAVWGVPEMSRAVVVRPDGKITLPAIGDVKADQVSPEELSKILTEKMAEYIKQPIVTVSVSGIQNSRVYLTGGGKSQVFNLSKKTTLMKMMSELGDFAETDLRRAYVSRDGKKIDTDFYALYYEGDMSQDVELKAEDIVFIPSNKRNLVYVLGAVGTPQQLQHYEGMTILDAILAAGNFTEFAKESSVFVIDKNKKKKKIDLKKVKQGKDLTGNVQLNPGDYVIVEESLF
ncbi:polysaccharide export outer membrane protein [Malonomonas rubra DSM 5091]|uniref:Polysaccharide export outer membrane protein n=1 Tax=Malonomonas rubra DSM 5091 TaxID=1122189 RepID=A0A1M6KF44_MALRU|nr:polysaccharide biosynthesis/export family protein [Malonomonas rubra]SHJ57487.1 polysaccharide export outer membrane protein [Malonomonas rubra DSM 5091]